MRKALLPALIATMFAASTTCVSAGELELLFGPGGSNKTSQVSKDSEKLPKAQSKKHKDTSPVDVKLVKAEKVAPAPVVVVKAEPKVVKVETPPVAKAPAAKVVAEVVKPVVVVKAEPKAVKVETPPVAKAPAAKVVAEVVKPVVVVKAEPKAVKVETPPVAKAPAVKVVAEVVKPVVVVTSSGGGERASGNNALSQRAALINKYDKQINFGYMPSLLTSSENYDIYSSYLPMMNVISQDSGYLVNGVAARDEKSFRASIAKNEFPILLIGTPLFNDATTAGYKLASISTVQMQTAFLVLENSKFKDMASVSGAKIAFPGVTPTTMLGQHEISRLGIKDKNTYIQMKSGAADVVRSSLDNLSADVFAVRSSVADQIMGENPGKYRAIGQTEKVTPIGVFLRQGSADNKEVQKVVNALNDLSAARTPEQKTASKHFYSGYGIPASFKEPEASERDKLTPMVAEHAKNWNGSVMPAVYSDELQANRDGSAFTRIYKKSDIGDIAESQRLLGVSQQSLAIGFMAPGSTSRDLHSFRNNFRPLSNYLSATSGALVNLIQERDHKQFLERMGRKEYPALLIGPVLTKAALDSGYKPVARAGDVTAATLLVSIDSKIEKFSDVAGKKIAAIRQSNAIMAGRWELSTSDTKPASIEYIGSSAESANVLTSGSADAVLLDSQEADVILASNKDAVGNSLYKLIRSSSTIPTLSMWVHSEAANSAQIEKIASAFQTFDNSGLNDEVSAFNSFAKATGYSASWKSAALTDYNSTLKMIDVMKMVEPDLYFAWQKTSNDDQFIAQATTPLKKNSSNDSLKRKVNGPPKK